MYLRAKKRIKDGKEHRYWSIVESCRNLDGRVVQRQVLYLGEINDGQKAAWCRTIDVLQTDSSAKQMALFPTDRQAPELDCEVVQVKLNEIRLHRPRQWGACWLALKLWEQLELDRFWQQRLPMSRQGTKWLDVLKTQVCYQLIDPGSEWRLHRHWYEHSAMQDLLASATRVLCDDTLYRCLDKLLAHKRAFFSFLRQRWEVLFQARFDDEAVGCDNSGLQHQQIRILASHMESCPRSRRARRACSRGGWNGPGRRPWGTRGGCVHRPSGRPQDGGRASDARRTPTSAPRPTRGHPRTAHTTIHPCWSLQSVPFEGREPYNGIVRRAIARALRTSADTSPGPRRLRSGFRALKARMCRSRSVTMPCRPRRAKTNRSAVWRQHSVTVLGRDLSAQHLLSDW